MSGFCLLVSGFLWSCQSTAGADDAPQAAPNVAAAPAADPRIAEMQVLIAELLDRIEVLNARLQRMESGTPPAAVPVQTATATATRPAPSGEAAVPQRPAPLSAPLAGAALAERYRAALAAYGKGALDESRRLFQEVFDSEPSGELADNALYWIAETYFVTARYSEAMKLYRRILTDYSDENKAPDAMLKMGLAYAKLGDLSLARRTFQELMQKYPYSTPASAAKQEIKRIQY